MLFRSLADRHEVEKKYVVAKLIACAWKKSATTLFSTGDFVEMEDEFLRSLSDTMLDQIFAVIYGKSESTMKRWREKQGVAAIIPRSVAVFQSEKEPGAHCEFRRWEYYSLMRVLLKRKVRQIKHYYNLEDSIREL